jgi:ATP-dependent helicase/nuclease subunit A
MAVTLPSIVQQLRPSPEQRDPIMDRGRDVVVTAGAGTGKTRTLVGRYLSLLDERVPLRKIVAITFTLRAAREIRNRVREEVRRFLETEPEQQESWREAYDGLDAARIGTIHSLCAEILRRHPVEAGLDPRFAMLEEGQMALERARAVSTALSWAADEESAACLFDYYQDASLRALLTSAMERSLDVTLALRGNSEAIWSTWQPLLLAPFCTFFRDPAVIDEMQVLLDARASGLLDDALSAGDKLAPYLAEALGHWDAAQDAIASQDLAACASTAARWRSAIPGGKGTARVWGQHGVKEAAAALRAIFDESMGFLPGPDALIVDERIAGEILPAFVAVYRHAQDAYCLVKQQRRALDFDDLESRTLTLLSEHPDVLCEWQGEVEALLVDEFQDTNGRQRDLVQLLNGNRGRLFIVGDAKQSIYGFRGADVTVFRSKRAEIIAAGSPPHDLSTTYRAHPGLVGAHMALLQPVLGTDPDPARPFVEPFGNTESGRDGAAEGITPPFVELHLAPGTRDGGAPERAARALAHRLSQLMAAGIRLEQTDPETGERATVPLNYGHVAILCRATSSFAPFEDGLEAAGIRYLTVSGRGFYGRPEVRDLLNALQALGDPSDDLAMVGLLRSPAFAVDDMTIYNLRQSQRDLELPSLWALVESLAGSSSAAGVSDATSLCALPESLNGLRRAHDVVARLSLSMGRRSAADQLKAYVDETRYLAILLAGGQERAVRNVRKLLDDAAASGMMSAGELEDYVAALRDTTSREGEAHGLASEAVQIMSIHQAKGLEFPIVVIGDVSKEARNSDGLLVDNCFGLVLPPPREVPTDLDEAGGSPRPTPVSLAYRRAQAAQADREAAEADRLLYVAATRAEEMLILCGVVRTSQAGKLQPAGMLARLDTALDLGAHVPACGANGTQTHVCDWTLPCGEKGKPVAVRGFVYEPNGDIPPAAPPTERAPSAETSPPVTAMLEPLVPAGTHRDVALQRVDLDPPQRVWRVVPRTKRPYAPAWVIGQLVHRALSRWSFPDSDPGFARWADAEAQDCGLTSPGERRDALSGARRLLGRFQGSPLYREMASAERLDEVPYSVLGSDGEVDSGIIDSLYRTASGWTLVEFKTDDVRSEDGLQRLLDRVDYVPQVARYLYACEQLLPRAEDGQPARVKPVLCFLDCMRNVRLVEDRWQRSPG